MTDTAIAAVERYLAEAAKASAKAAEAQAKADAIAAEQAEQRQRDRHQRNLDLVSNYDENQWRERLEQAEAAFDRLVSEQPWARAWIEVLRTAALWYATASAADAAKQELGTPSTTLIPTSRADVRLQDRLQATFARVANAEAADELEQLHR